MNFWSIKTSVDIEALSADFSPIEQYRTVEFNRDWNTRGQNYTGTQFSSNISGSIKHQNKGEFELKGQQYLIGEDYIIAFDADGRNIHKEIVRGMKDISINIYPSRKKFESDKKIKPISSDTKHNLNFRGEFLFLKI